MQFVSWEQIVAATPDWEDGARQALGFEAGFGAPLVCDGVVGPKTKAGVYYLPHDEDLDLGTMLGQMLRFVREQRREVLGDNNAGPDVQFMFYGHAAAPLWKPGAWCAATISRAILEAGCWAWFRFNSGARRLTDEVAKLGGSVPLARVARGDLLSWAVPRPKNPYGGHICAVLGVQGDKLVTVEGNGAAARGQVRVYLYDLPDALYGKDKHKVWRVVRPEAVRR